VTPRHLLSVGVDRAALPSLLFVAAVLAAVTLQVALWPRQPALFIPPTLGTPRGAAPQQSVAPPSASAASISSTVLPSESAPPQSLPSADQPSSAMAAKSEPSLWSDRLPRIGALEAGAGNIKSRLKQPTAITTMIAALLRSLKRVEPGALVHTKPVMGHPPKPATPQSHAAPASLNVSRPGWTLGGPAPRPTSLGGPTPLAARYGATVGHQ